MTLESTTSIKVKRQLHKDSKELPGTSEPSIPIVTVTKMVGVIVIIVVVDQ